MLTTRHYGLVGDGIITQSIQRIEDDEGPPTSFAGDMDYRLLPAAPDWSGKPTATAVLRWVGHDTAPVWEETATLADLKARKNAEIDAARESANRTYFDFAGKRIACGDVDWKDIMSASAEIALTREMPEDWVGFWKGKDPDGNTQYLPIPDVATWTLFIQAMVARGQTHFRKSQALKVILAAATTAEEIAVITW